MSINWVMAAQNWEAFAKLPNESILYTSPPRVYLQISPPASIANVAPYSVKSDSGVVFVTSQRIVYIPAKPTKEFQSFSAPYANLQDSHSVSPWFGANYWIALCKPVVGGGIPTTQIAVEVKMTFQDGGVFDFSAAFERVKERIQQVREANGNTGGADVHLEQLPAYEAAREDDDLPILSPTARPELARRRSTTPPPQMFTAPDEPPPGYEEAQAQAVGSAASEKR